MKCHHIPKGLAAYQDGEVSGKEQARIAAHLERCPACRSHQRMLVNCLGIAVGIALVSLVALVGAVFLIIKTMLANLVERSREIGILKAVGWTGTDVRKQIMGEVFVQAVLGGVAGIVAGYLISYLLGYFSIPVSTPWELNQTPSFARDAAAAAQTIRRPVHLSAPLIAASMALSLVAGGCPVLSWPGGWPR